MPSSSASRQRDLRRQRGIAFLLPIFLIMAVVALGSLAVGIGQVLLSRSQIQASADSAARAAVAIIRLDRSQLEAREVAKSVAAGTRALDSPILIVDGDVRFGDYSHQTRQFTQNGTANAPAVRVRARRTSGSPAGPITLVFNEFFGPRHAEVEAYAVASIGCREIVFAIDASSGMQDETAEVRDLVSELIDRLFSLRRPGDKVGITYYAADALSAQDYAENGGTFWSRPIPEELSMVRPDRVDLDAWIRAMELEGNVCADVEDGRLPTLGPGSCLGKGDHHGINRAVEMFDENDQTCSAENERMIVLITSETPCTYWGARIGDWRNWYGGTVAQAYAAADAAALRGINIAAVLVDNGNQGQCTTPWQQGLAPDVFVENMVRGVVDAALIQPTQSEFDDILEDVNEVLRVRLVQ